MVNISDQKVKDIIQCMHEAMQRKVKRGGSTKEDIVTENRIFSLMCHNFEIEPRKCAIKMNDSYGCDLTGNDVIEIFRSRRMANPNIRKELLQWAESVADYFAKAMGGDTASYEKFEKISKEIPLKNGKKHESQERMAVIMLYEKHPEIDLFDDISQLHLLGNTLARYLFYDISDVVGEAYGFLSNREGKKKQADQKAERKLSYEEAVSRMEMLEKMLERSNLLLQDLQDEFEEQLNMAKIKELADFFARLNSEKYGCILDELLVVRKGVEELRKSSFELPIEINGLLIMVKKMIQFVRDSHIEPVMKINSILEVTASDVEFCNYEGTPFLATDEKKKVKVVSPGWIYRDRELQISRPKVKEEK